MQESVRQRLLNAAIAARLSAWAPYSGFQVGAALLGKSGRIYSGCNVENVSYGATICAERTAAVKAVSEGETAFLALAIAVAGNQPVTPCGICRQFLNEFGTELEIISVNVEGERLESNLKELLPQAFERSEWRKT
jgi:cytidine deaminase